jgi:transglutaminase-like putative cysteine protease
MLFGESQPAIPTYAASAPRQRLQTQSALGDLGAPQPGPSQLKEVPYGFQGTAQIVAEMTRLALDAYGDERINILARQITMGCPGHDKLCEADTIFRWFQDTFRYTFLPFHPKGFQRLQTPSYTLFESPVRTGECASLSTALAAVLMSIGLEVQFETAGSDANDPLGFEHVYMSIKIPDKGWVVADPSYKGPLGWLHPSAKVTRSWPLS